MRTLHDYPILLVAVAVAAIAAVMPCIAATATMATASTTTKPGCPRHCGNVTIPYPFGIGLRGGCSLNTFYDVFCNLSSTPNAPFLMGKGGSNPFSSERDGVVEILDISESRVRVRNRGVARTCFNASGHETTPVFSSSYSMFFSPGSPFTFSPASTLFTVIGCQESGSVSDESAIIDGTSSSCGSQCPTKDDVVAGQCDRSGCCQVPVPKGLRGVRVSLGLGSNNTDVVSFNPCGYAFVAEKGGFNFRGLSDLNDPGFVQRVIDTVPVAVDWAISNGTCDQARANPSTYACAGNTTCSDNLDNGIGGYKCFCQSGFQGNPYLSPGCYDIDECADSNLNNCTMACQNTIGSFRCRCPPGYVGDGRKNGTSCAKKGSDNLVLKLCLGISSSVLFLVIGFSWFYVIDRKKKLVEMKRKFFEQNGGYLLHERLSTGNHSVGNAEAMRVFTEEQLKEATNNFDKDRILGNGGYGTVYKGILPESNQVVAIKKSKVVDQDQIEQFINEVVILGQVNHRNVVKLLGCCLETEVPLLVYEFVSNGTLYTHIHEPPPQGGIGTWRLTWNDCLRISSEAAGALAYLHSAASPPIVHRDIKSMNILLDDGYTAKIADFGASRLIPMDQTKLSTLVQGTLGYLDPEYFHSSMLTEKSDVYSFGVVVAELLTRQKPLSPSRPEEDRSLATYLVRSIEQETLFDILYPQWLSEASKLELTSMASIIQRCLKLNGKDRPTMKQVCMELEAINNIKKKQSHENNQTQQTTMHLLHSYSSSRMTETETTMSQDEENDMYPILKDARINM